MADSVYWTPIDLNRSMDARPDAFNTIFVFLQGADGAPVVGVGVEDLAALQGLIFAEWGRTDPYDALADPIVTNSWAAVGPAYPGLYLFRVPTSPFIHDENNYADQVIFSLQITADPDRYYFTSVTLLEQSGGGGGGDDDRTNVLFGLMGGNGVYKFEDHDGRGQPARGTLTVYPTRQAAEDETDPIAVLDMLYEYDAQGRLTKVKKLIDLSNGD